MTVTRELRRQVHQALNSHPLRAALDNFAESYPLSRAEAYQALDFEQLRERLATMRLFVLEHLEELATQFAEQAQAKGASVYRAQDGAQANRYVEEIARCHGVSCIVKSKSMLSEEIELNQYLAGRGIKVIETDLGEWILQLAGQKPSHMVMPAIHLTRKEVAAIFSKYLGRPVPPDIQEMVTLARQELRKAFLEADMGITGANLAIAESGTVGIVSNEGNARLTTTLPPVHLVLVGYEKLVPAFTDAATVLTALPRSATGQQATSYMSFITGCVPAAGNVSDGGQLKDYHIVLVDNGRLRLRDEPDLKDTLKCIRCASCVNVCPAYRSVGGHVFGDIYPGGIGAILAGFLSPTAKAHYLHELCLGCGRCQTVCPVKIDIPALILAWRYRLASSQGLPGWARLFLRKVLAYRKRFHGSLRLVAGLQKPVVKQGKMSGWAAELIKKATGLNIVPVVNTKPLRTQLSAGMISALVPKKGTVAIYAGCLLDFVYPEMGRAMVNVLTREGFAVEFPAAQTCCGMPAAYMGDRETAVKLAQINLTALGKTESDWILSACPTCTVALKTYYPQLLSEIPAWREKAAAVSARTADFSLFLYHLRHGDAPAASVRKLNKPLTVYYHLPCHAQRGLGITTEPVSLLNGQGVVKVVAAEGDYCCGFAGSYALKLPELSASILERKIARVLASEAKMLVTDCPGCILQFRQGFISRGLRGIQVRHTAEILAENECATE